MDFPSLAPSSWENLYSISPDAPIFAMATRSTYPQYKQDEQYLVYWITRSTARIAKKLSLESAGLVSADGGITLSALLSCSELIAKYVSPIPSTIFRIFASVIKARKERHEAFVRLAENNPAPEVLESNTTHKIWLEGLSEAFRLLGDISGKIIPSCLRIFLMRTNNRSSRTCTLLWILTKRRNMAQTIAFTLEMKKTTASVPRRLAATYHTKERGRSAKKRPKREDAGRKRQQTSQIPQFPSQKIYNSKDTA